MTEHFVINYINLVLIKSFIQEVEHESIKKSLRVLASLSIAATVSLTATVPNVLAVTQPEADTPLTKDKLQKLSVQNIEKLSNGVKLDLGTNEAYIRIFDKDLVKVSVVKKGEKEFESRGIAKKASEWKLLASVQTLAQMYTL